MKRNSELHVEEIFLDGGENRETPYAPLPASRGAFFLVAGVATLLAVGIFGKVGFLNVVRGAFYEVRASANVSREINLPSYRSVILDRYGEVIAENEGSASIFLNVSTFLLANPERRASISEKITDILRLESAEFDRLIGEADLVKNNWVPLARDVSSGEVIAVKALNEPAIQIVDDYRRIYREGRAFAHVVGYTGIGEGNSVVGKSGIELEYDEEIRGKDGRYIFFEDASGTIVGNRIVSPPEPGKPFETTIDADLQRFFYHRLTEALASLGRDAGLGIALQPKTGEVLALVSVPSFDANVFVDRKRAPERAEILNNPGQPLFNRAISGAYSPGSTFKPVVALAALRENILNSGTAIFSDGALEIPNPYFPDLPSVFLDWKAHGWVNLAGALARSSNIYFYLAGGGIPRGLQPIDLVLGTFDRGGLGAQKIMEYAARLGFGSKTGIDLPAEGESFLPTPDERETRSGEAWRVGDTYNVSIGQGDLSVTPIQLVSFIAGLGNGGVINRPSIRKGSTVTPIADFSDWQGEIKEVQKGLEDAVREPYGSSHMLSNLPISVAGKTGTPQIANKRRVNAFFMGYAPTDDPEIAILVAVENAREGSLNTLPIARDVFQWYYEHRMAGTNVQ
ncbi:MAG: penicillin-binding transpeptidase domain-containing protein [Patescibacteria group bacterium]